MSEKILLIVCDRQTAWKFENEAFIVALISRGIESLQKYEYNQPETKNLF